MTFSDQQISATVARYHREYDRYLKLCARVAEICRLEIVEGNAIRAQVTSRAKSPKSLEGKLRRIVAGNKKPLTDLDSVFVHLRDLAAVRIATYEHRHEAQVVELVGKRFLNEAGVSPSPEVKDYLRERPNQDNYYRATHIEVFLPPTDLVGTYANVAGVPCEIQVCSMMAHVWNEIEHDLGYKPMSGSLSTFEKNQLKHLGMNARMADDIISQLLAETDKRQAEQTASFSDVYDFVARVRGWFPGVDFGRHAGPLFDELRPLRLLTVESLRKAIDLPDPIAAGAVQRLAVLKARADGATFRSLADLDESSSDLLLVALLPQIANFLFDPSAAGEPSRNRVRAIARAYLLSTVVSAETVSLDFDEKRDSTLTPDAVIRKILTAYMSGVKRCHKDLLKTNPGARGKITLSFIVGEDGHTVAPDASGFDPSLDACLVAQMRNWRFEIPRDAAGEPTEASFEVTLGLAPE